MTTALYLPEENIGKRMNMNEQGGRMRQLTSVKNRSDASAAPPPHSIRSVTMSVKMHLQFRMFFRFCFSQT